MIGRILQYLLEYLDQAKLRGDKATSSWRESKERLWKFCGLKTCKERIKDGHVRTDSMLEGFEAGLTACFLAKLYPELCRYMIMETV